MIETGSLLVYNSNYLFYSGIEKVVMCALDYATPLQIQTSPAHSSSSTDTSSEIGSAFNSPTQGNELFVWGYIVRNFFSYNTVL